jgi:hypothetical protein
MPRERHRALRGAVSHQYQFERMSGGSKEGLSADQIVEILFFDQPANIAFGRANRKSKKTTPCPTRSIWQQGLSSLSPTLPNNKRLTLCRVPSHYDQQVTRMSEMGEKAQVMHISDCLGVAALTMCGRYQEELCKTPSKSSICGMGDVPGGAL